MTTNLPQTVINKVTGETVTFLETAEDTNGAHLLIEVSLPPFGQGPPLHTHDEFTESFECLKGNLTLKVGSKTNEMTLRAVETYSVPTQTAHTFLNKHEEPLTFTVKLSPPRHFEESMRIHYGLMNDGLTDAKGNPKSIAHTALILTLQNTRIVGIPIGLQRIIFNAIVKRNLKKGKYANLESYIGKPIAALNIFG